ncbi:MAG TPA: hypothetical protein HPQ00_13180 [Magnetococcales bacterium]|nr:hypothetical protein [Magnetococcales bacterium]
MIRRFLNWMFRSLAPYLVGVLLGVGFFVLLIRSMDGPGGLLQSAPGFAGHVGRFSLGVMENISDLRGMLSSTDPAAEVLDAGGKTALDVVGGGKGLEWVQDGMPVADSVSVPMPVVVPPQAVMAKAESHPVAKETKAIRDALPSADDPVRKEFKPRGKTEDCGFPPLRPGPDQERYMACQWRRNCQVRLENYQKMIDQGLRGCPENTTHAQMCRNFYRSMQLQNPPQVCDRPWPGVNRMP